ncbi:hypothetical protein [Methylovulum psychrotolerans]|nr:hypothetical protein [Methylovulum psychrotolerans]
MKNLMIEYKQIRFGLFDSTALFIDGDNVLIPAVLAAFTKVEPLE